MASEICLLEAPETPFAVSAESLKIFFECVGKKYGGDVALRFNDKGQIVIAGENDNLLVTDLTAPPTNSERTAWRITKIACALKENTARKRQLSCVYQTDPINFNRALV